MSTIFTLPWVWRVRLLCADLGSPRFVLPYQNHVLASTGARPHRLYVRRIMRNKQKVHEGKVTSLRRVKDDVKEVSAGLECGLAVETYLGWREGGQNRAVRDQEQAADPRGGQPCSCSCCGSCRGLRLSSCAPGLP